MGNNYFNPHSVLIECMGPDGNSSPKPMSYIGENNGKHYYQCLVCGTRKRLKYHPGWLFSSPKIEIEKYIDGSWVDIC
jgi:hypothetical protein